MLTVEKRNKLILDYIPLANKIAYREKKKCPKMSFDEVQSAAYYGLVDAAVRCENISTFGCYAKIRIFCAINDYFRQIFLRPEKNMFFEKEYSVNFDSPSEVIEKLIKNFSLLEQNIMIYYFCDDMTLKEIGKKCNLSESRICQIIKNCCQSIKENLE